MISCTNWSSNKSDYHESEDLDLDYKVQIHALSNYNHSSFDWDERISKIKNLK